MCPAVVAEWSNAVQQIPVAISPWDMCFSPCFLDDFTMFWSLDKSLLVQGISKSCMWEYEYIVGCQGASQLGGPCEGAHQGYNVKWQGGDIYSTIYFIRFNAKFVKIGAYLQKMPKMIFFWVERST